MVRAQDYARLVGGRGRSFREDTGHGSRRAGRPRRGRPGAFPPPRRRPSLASSTTTHDVRWAAVKEMAEPPEDPDAPGSRGTTTRRPGSRGTRHATTREESRRGSTARCARSSESRRRVVREYYENIPTRCRGVYTANGRRTSRGTSRRPSTTPWTSSSASQTRTRGASRTTVTNRYKRLNRRKPSRGRASSSEGNLRRAAADDDFFSGGGDGIRRRRSSRASLARGARRGCGGGGAGPARVRRRGWRAKGGA